MNLKLRAWLPKAKMMAKNIEKDDDLNEIIQDNNNGGSCYILMQATEIKDKHRNNVYSGDYILYDSGFVRNFKIVTETKLGFAFCSWDKHKKRWRHSTYNGIDTYGEIIGNIYEGVRTKKLYKEMKEIGINIVGGEYE